MDSDSDKDIKAFELQIRTTRKMIYKIVKDILDDICSSVFEIAKRTSWKCKHYPYTITEFNLCKQFRVFGKIECLSISPDGQTALIGHSTGLLALNIQLKEIVSHWQSNNKSGIISISIIDIALKEAIMMLTLDELGIARFIVYKDPWLIKAYKMNNTEPGSFIITDFTIYEKKSVLILNCKNENNNFLEIYLLPVDNWSKQIIVENFYFTGADTFPVILYTILEPTIGEMCQHFQTDLFNVESILSLYKSNLYSKQPYFVSFKPWLKLCPDTNLGEVFGLAVWWSADNNVYFHVVFTNTNRIDSVGSDMKPVITWHHSDRISRCVINESSTLIAIALENGTLAIKQLNTGVIKHLVRLCSFGRIRALYFVQNVETGKIKFEDLTKESNVASTSTLCITNASVLEKTPADTSTENLTYESGTSIIRKTWSTKKSDDDDDEDDEESEDYTPTPSWEEDKANDDMIERVEKVSKDFTCDVSSDYMISTKIGDSHPDFGTKSVNNIAVRNDIGGTVPGSNISNETDDNIIEMDATESVTTSYGLVVRDKSSSSLDVSYVAKLISKFQSGFSKPNNKHESKVDFCSLLVALSDGSLWQLKWSCQKELKHLIAETNDNDEIISLQQTICKPNLVICFTKLGRIYLIDPFSNDKVAVKEVFLPITHAVFNPSKLIHDIVFNGKVLYIAGGLNVDKNSTKYLAGELFAIDLFPEMDIKRAVNIATSQESSTQSDLSGISLIKFRPSFHNDIESQLVLKEIHGNFLKWCTQSIDLKE